MRFAQALAAFGLLDCANSVTPTPTDAQSTLVTAPPWCDLGVNATIRSADFSGPELGPDWNTAGVGSAPAYRFDGGWLTISDAAFASTPSAPDRSWIYDSTTDLGNQMTWHQPIGTADFVVSFEFDWSSSVAELTLAGVGLTNAEHQLEIYGGYSDPWNTTVGAPFARIRSAGATRDWQGSVAMAGRGSMTVARHQQTVTVMFSDHAVLIADNSGSITDVAIFSVRHRDVRGAYPFGLVRLTTLRVCY